MLFSHSTRISRAYIRHYYLSLIITVALYELLEKGLIPRSELFVVFHVCPLNVVLSKLLSVFSVNIFFQQKFSK